MMQRAAKSARLASSLTSRGPLAASRRAASTFMADYDAHVAERAKQGIVPLPLDAPRTSALVKMLSAPPADEADRMLDLLTNRVPPGVDEAAYIKAGYLAAIVKGEASSPLISKKVRRARTERMAAHFPTAQTTGRGGARRIARTTHHRSQPTSTRLTASAGAACAPSPPPATHKHIRLRAAG